MMAACPRRTRLDTLRRIATPEGCVLVLRLAGPVVRARAYLLDLLLRGLILLASYFIAGYLQVLGYGLAILMYFLVGWFYPLLFEVLNAGATPGKRWCGIQVLREDGTPLGWDAGFLRNTLRFVDSLPLGYAAGLVTMGLDPDGRRIGDLLAGTVVVYRPAAVATGVNHSIGAEPPACALEPDEQRALLEYHQRSGNLTRERAEELARLAVPLTNGLSPAEGRLRLLRNANYLLGWRED
jgi:uncharacterized RDD family membrane protein YckC